MLIPLRAGVRQGEPLVIFDCDGVLVDSEVAAARIMAAALVGDGFPITAEDIQRRYVGLNRASFSERLEAEYGRCPAVSTIDSACQEVSRAVSAYVAPVDGVAQLLEDLGRFARVVASSSPLTRVRASLLAAGLDRHFEEGALYVADMVERGKPHPDLFLHAAAEHRRDPAACIVVEDSVAGVTAGVAAGMVVLGFVAGGHNDQHSIRRLGDAGAHAVATTAESASSYLGHFAQNGRCAHVAVHCGRLDGREESSFGSPPVVGSRHQKRGSGLGPNDEGSAMDEGMTDTAVHVGEQPEMWTPALECVVRGTQATPDPEVETLVRRLVELTKWERPEVATKLRCHESDSDIERTVKVLELVVDVAADVTGQGPGVDRFRRNAVELAVEAIARLHLAPDQFAAARYALASAGVTSKLSAGAPDPTEHLRSVIASLLPQDQDEVQEQRVGQRAEANERSEVSNDEVAALVLGDI